MSQNSFLRRMRRSFYLAFGCLLLTGLFLLLLAGGADRTRQEALAERIAPAVLRFHVMANSDRKEDQEIKLEVRSRILNYLRERLSPDADKSATLDYIRDHSSEIRDLADQYLHARQVPYRSRLQITHCYFPTRSYGRVTFPCGSYDAVRVTLGSGRGHNWWCVLYPQFCFLDVTCQTEPHKEQALARLKDILKEDDYQALADPRPQIQIRFLLPRLFNLR